MHNMSEEKKLQIKSELIKHLETAKTMERNNVPSSQLRVFALQFDIEAMDMGVAPDMKFWNAVMQGN